MYEVELKLKVGSRSFNRISKDLLDMSFEKSTAKQFDTYVRTDKRRITARVRKETTQGGAKYYLTQKKRVGANAKDEQEREISESVYSTHLSRPVVLCGVPLTVRKTRIHFKGKFEDHDVTVCLDVARGPRQIRLGNFVELEIQVGKRRQIAATRRRLKRLARKLLPPSARLERRGYRRMVLDVLETRCE
jgi:adenylate cyclase class IV